MTRPADAPPSTPRAAGHVLSLTDPEGVGILRRKMDAAGFTTQGVRKALGIEAFDAIPRSEFPRVSRSLPPGDPISTLLSLFQFGFPVGEEALGRAIEPLGVDRLETLGLVKLGKAGATPLVRIHPFGRHLFASDRWYESFADTPADYVLEPNPTSQHLACFTPRRRVLSTLDLGCGCGVLSVLAAEHSGRVVATDINPRALNFTAFNAQLNGCANIECAEGSLLEPVAGRTFDLIMSNPPYVISPDATLQFRDSGWPLDSFLRELVRGLPAHLNEGGTAVVLGNWVPRKGENWAERPAEWVSDSGCDAIIFRAATQTGVEYAGLWNRILATDQPALYQQILDRWLEYYRSVGLETIIGGRIILRRRKAAQNWGHTVDGAVSLTPTSGEHVLRIIEAHDWLAVVGGPAEFMKASFRPVGDFRLEQALVWRDGRMAPGRLAAKLAGGFQLEADLDPLTWQVLSALDGRRSLHEILEGMAAESGASADDLSKRVFGMLRNLYAGGFLVRD